LATNRREPRKTGGVSAGRVTRPEVGDRASRAQRGAACARLRALPLLATV
jgi:hypothetical protein